MVQVLQHHWEVDPGRSWFGLFREDIKQVSQFEEAAQVLLGKKCAVRALCDSLLSDSSWWVRTVRGAVRRGAKDLQAAASRPAMPAQTAASRTDDTGDVSPAMPVLPFSCRHCPAAFRLRKHLGTHLLRCHGIMSPARHFAVAQHCVSCMRFFHDVRRVQSHLKLSPQCLDRAVRVIAPLLPAKVLALEEASVAQAVALKRGKWSRFTAVAPSTPFYGPRLPTRRERLDPADESISVSSLAQGFMPHETDVQWIEDYLAQATTEGPREASGVYWSREAILAGAAPLSFPVVSPACSGSFETRPTRP